MKVALIGCGSIAKTHLDVLKHLGHDVIALCDRSEEKAVKLRDDFGLDCKVYTDYAVMMDKAKPDSVHVCTPHYEHAEMSIAALNRGINVLCEKPVTGNAEDVRVLENIQKETGKFVAVGYQWSYSKAIQRLKKDVTDGVFGNALFMKSLVFWPRDLAYFTRSTGWAGKIYASNGKLIRDSIVNNATAHYIHNILYILGGKTDAAISAKDVQATLLRTNDIETFDTATVRFSLANGAAGLFVVSHCTEETIGPEFEYTFKKGKVVFPNGAGHIEAVMDNGEVIDYGDPFAEGAAYKFYKCLEVIQNGGKDVLCGLNAAKEQVFFVSQLHENNQIVNSLPASVTEFGGRLIVKGLGELLKKCYLENKLLSELQEFQEIAER